MIVDPFSIVLAVVLVAAFVMVLRLQRESREADRRYDQVMAEAARRLAERPEDRR